MKFRNNESENVSVTKVSVVLITSSDCYKILCGNFQ